MRNGDEVEKVVYSKSEYRSWQEEEVCKLFSLSKLMFVTYMCELINQCCIEGNGRRNTNSFPLWDNSQRFAPRFRSD